MEISVNKTSNQANSPRIIAFSLGHLVNDMYMSQIQVMIPYLVLAGLSISKGSFLVSIFTITSSLVQPVFGYYSDKSSKAWLVFSGTIWMAVLLGLLGNFSNYWVMMLVVAAAGLGTAAFHPQASAMVARNSGPRKTFAQAIFIASGNVGWAITPLVAVPLMDRYGLAITPAFMVPGLVIGILLWLTSRNLTYINEDKKTRPIIPQLKKHWHELSKIMGIVALRSLSYFSFISFLPLYLKQSGTSLVVGGRLVFLMLFTGSIGGLIGGMLADIYGRKRVTIISLCLASPLFYFFSITAGLTSILFLGLAGAFLLATFSVTVTLAHREMEQNAGLASGLMLGFGTGIGGLGVGILGKMADVAGINLVVNILIWLPLLGGLLAFRLKNK